MKLAKPWHSRSFLFTTSMLYSYSRIEISVLILHLARINQAIFYLFIDGRPTRNENLKKFIPVVVIGHAPRAFRKA